MPLCHDVLTVVFFYGRQPVGPPYHPQPRSPLCFKRSKAPCPTAHHASRLCHAPAYTCMDAHHIDDPCHHLPIDVSAMARASHGRTYHRHMVPLTICRTKMGAPRHPCTLAKPQNPNIGYLITLHMSPHYSPPSVAYHGHGLPIKAPPWRPSTFPSHCCHSMATHEPHQAIREGEEGRRREGRSQACRSCLSSLEKKMAPRSFSSL